MPAQIQFELVSPVKMLVGKPVAMVVIPGGEGDYGVMAGHAPILTNVRPGVVAVYEHDDQTISASYFIAGGFAEVTAERCTLLAEDVVPVGDLNREDILATIKTLHEEIPAANEGAERAALEARLTVAQAKLAVAA